jgi:hypothetical protein
MKKLIIILSIFISLNVSAGWEFNPVLNLWYNTETGELSVTGEDDEDMDVGSIRVINNIGNQVGEGMKKPDEYNTAVVKMNILPQGVYFVMVYSKDKTKVVTKRLVVNK